MIVTVTLETGEVIETNDLLILTLAKNSEGLLDKLNSDESFTIIDIYGEEITKKWSLIESINIKI